jgi:hypothetical protein
MRPEKGLLGPSSASAELPQHAYRHAKHSVLISLHELLEGSGLADPAPVQQLLGLRRALSTHS